MIEKRILILFAHPVLHKSRVNMKLIKTIEGLESITFHNLYETYPDFHIDIKHEQNLLLEHDLIVWQHPFYWYSAPAMIKEWIDLVLQHGFAYGRTGTALKGKQMFTAITTGGRKEAYQTGGFNQYSIRHYLAPFERTVTLCYMEYLPPFVVHGSHLLSEEEMDKAAIDYKKILISLRDDIFDLNDLMNLEYINDILTMNKQI